MTKLSRQVTLKPWLKPQKALLRVHIVGSTEMKKRITVIDGGEEIDLDLTTKNYVEKEIMGAENTQDVSVAALNVNNRTGRVYLHDEGRTVPFLVHRDAHGRTITNLSIYLNQYAKKTGATVNIRFRPMSHIDGRIKRLIIFDCFDIQDAA